MSDALDIGRMDSGSGVNKSAAVASTNDQRVLGEGVRWDDRRDELLRVDIVTGHVHRDLVADDGSLIPVRTYEVDGTVGAIAPVHGDDGWLLAAGRGFSHLSPDGSVRRLVEVAPARSRMNDAACDPRGRFWAGTVAEDQHPGGGCLYRLDVDGRTEMVLDELTIPNGLGWSPDGATMYLADSAPGVVYEFDFDASRGTMSNRRVLISVEQQVGAPDGLTVDVKGHLWVAVYGGGRINHYSADG
ncbi:MAG TPA: SMP-30/gluconolactonase/LRE family protein, partial [Ilumatobacteraceae bacterium]|nr:SMP-30/gluconolactonase/LRE family protein [Ilumatobacteraceae bacterium]